MSTISSYIVYESYESGNQNQPILAELPFQKLSTPKCNSVRFTHCSAVKQTDQKQHTPYNGYKMKGFFFRWAHGQTISFYKNANVIYVPSMSKAFADKAMHRISNQKCTTMSINSIEKLSSVQCHFHVRCHKNAHRLNNCTG